MTLAQLINYLLGGGGLACGAYATWRGVHADQRTASVQEKGADLQAMEASLEARAEDYNRMRELVADLRAEARTAKDEARRVENELAAARAGLRSVVEERDVALRRVSELSAFLIPPQGGPAQ